MKKIFCILSIFSIIYSCTKTETITPAPPVVIKISSCDSIKQGLLKNTSDTIRLVSCLIITGCDSVRLGILNSVQDLLRLGCNSISIKIGTQQWMKVNLDVVTYRNGDVIPQVTDASTWARLTTGAWCYYNNDPKNDAIYGKLYNWYAVSDPRFLAPQGWHIPTDAEFTTLSTALGGVSVAGGKMKTTGTTRWTTPNTGATNESGFAGLPGGYRSSSGEPSPIVGGEFYNVGNVGFWWSANQYNSNNTMSALRVSLYFGNVDLVRTANLKGSGFSVRCLRD